jgi:hypothetical protein
MVQVDAHAFASGILTWLSSFDVSQVLRAKLRVLNGSPSTARPRNARTVPYRRIGHGIRGDYVSWSHGLL